MNNFNKIFNFQEYGNKIQCNCNIDTVYNEDLELLGQDFYYTWYECKHGNVIEIPLTIGIMGLN